MFWFQNVTLSNYKRHPSSLSVSEAIMTEDSYIVVTLQGWWGCGLDKGPSSYLTGVVGVQAT